MWALHFIGMLGQQTVDQRPRYRYFVTPWRSYGVSVMEHKNAPHQIIQRVLCILDENNHGICGCKLDDYF